jgi:hypothetical protein
MKTLPKFRRLILILTFCIFTSAVSYGQAALIILILGDKVATENFYLSMDGALNVATLPGLNKGTNRIGVNFGLGTHIKLNEKWTLKPEIKFLSRKGARYVDTIAPIPSEIGSAETQLMLNYLEVPVLFQYNFNKRLFASAGPQFNYLTKASQLTTGLIDGTKDATYNLDVESFFNKFDLGLTAELGYLLSISTKRSTAKVDVNIFARYYYGFFDVFLESSPNSSTVSTLQLGLSFPFIKAPEGTQTK